ncbi:HAD-IIB family hydrolase [Thiomicrorhabdus sp. 6S2-11]|uniref:HAD-IIB family hydrolase n=1 Tax=Thiomicrorhabdus marina TaxID=2818442 RepID=A0ABS3Q2U8_9GAMM|nr:HAD-IIB family hydrolase [Thiomicrorhabdus marina]MBO1926438.1 HAD-IIB family hydrolase [Thiomicrorhabdus marina]
MTLQVTANPSGIFVFTDLDGTLLGHHDYHYQPVLPMLKKLQSLHIPVILNSSKTFYEMRDWLERLGLQPPFIAENGGVIYFSTNDENQKRLLGKDYSQIRQILQQLRHEQGFNFKGFGDGTVEDVMRSTSLDRASAQQAMQRAVTEPITWLDTMTRLEQFKTLLAEHGLQLQKGGRFYHVMAHHDKASALEWVVNQSVSAGRFGEQNSNLAEKVFAKSPWVFALGDGGNDKQMIQTADVGLVLPAANGDSLKIDRKNVFTAEKSSPYGWVEALQEYLINPLEQV